MKQPFNEKDLIADSFVHDSRVAEGKKLILSALNEHRSKITEIRAPDPGLKIPYEQFLKEFEQCRGGNLWFPYLGSGMGNGALVELLDGSVKYDFITGIGVHFWGHSHPDLISVAIDG